MPYRLNPKDKSEVQVFKGVWRKLKKHKSVKDAQRHLTALRANVEHKGKE